MNFYTNSTFQVQKGRGLGHVTQFRNFGTPYNFQANEAIRFKFDT